MIDREKTIGFKIRQLSNVLKRHGDKRHQQFESQNISMMQSWIIRFLAHNRDKDIFQKNLEQELNIGKSTLTEILHVMEKNDLVVRQPCREDNRYKRLVLTERGESIHKEVENDIETFEAKLRTGISDEEMEQFFRLINLMLENAQRE